MLTQTVVNLPYVIPAIILIDVETTAPKQRLFLSDILMIIQELSRKINPAAFIYIHSQSTTLGSP